MPTYAPMACRICGASLPPKTAVVAKRTPAYSFESCLYQCAICAVGYSNAADEEARTRFTKTPKANVPAEVGAGLDATLANALRGGKRKRGWFCAETSEDAVTWTFFRWLYDAHALGAVAAAAGEVATLTGSPRVLLWGAPLDAASDPLRDALASACDGVGESVARRSEVDGIIAWPELVIAVEAKYGSPNPTGAPAERFHRYLDGAADRFASEAEVVDADCYQLTRNWRLGTDVASAHSAPRFTLLNLGPAAILNDEATFAAVIKQTATRRFVATTWSKLLTQADHLTERPSWLSAWLTARHIS